MSNVKKILVCLKSALEQTGIVALQALLQTPQWQAAITAIPGYSALRSGEVLSLRKVLRGGICRRNDSR